MQSQGHPFIRLDGPDEQWGPACCPGLGHAEGNDRTRADWSLYGLWEPDFPYQPGLHLPAKGIRKCGLIPAPGSIVPPYDGSERTEIFLILALHVPEARGAYSFSGIMVDYHVGGQPYRMTFPYSLRLCTPPSAYTYLRDTHRITSGRSLGKAPLQ